MYEVCKSIINFLSEITYKDVIGLLIKIIGLCFIYIFICEGIDAIKWVIKCFTIEKFNHYTTKFQERIEERTIIPYEKKHIQSSAIIDISNIIDVIPKLVINIDIMTGKLQTKEVWRKRGICEKFIHPFNQGMSKSIKANAEKQKVEKRFVYTQALINTLNFNYFSWQELNPDFINTLQNESIVAEEVIIPYLRNFRK